MANSKLTADELAILEDAKQRGYYIRSGRRLAVLLTWQQWCRAAGHPEVVIRRGSRESVVMIGGRDVERVPHEQAGARAATLVREQAGILPGILEGMETGRKCG